MGKVIYFTSAQGKEEFNRTLHHWSVAPNLSNQNFHNKLVRSIGLTNTVEVISVRPINRHFSRPVLFKRITKEGKVTWKYVGVTKDYIHKKLFLQRSINKLAGKPESDDVVITDTLNLSILNAAKKYAKTYGLKIIGICTDNPSNISFTNENYQKELLTAGQSLDGYICLTEHLNALYNVNEKPFAIIDGVTEELDAKDSKHHIEGDYIFFGGSLMHKYGVFNLINAFNNLERKDLKLVVCGHHEEKNFKKFVKHFDNVIYLGALDYDEVNALESKSLVAVNPRPNIPEIDIYSFPSKTLEYLSNGTLTITVENPILMNKYKECIIWSMSGSAEDLKAALETALNMSEDERKKLKKLSKQTVAMRTSLANINPIVTKLILNVSQSHEQHE